MNMQTLDAGREPARSNRWTWAAVPLAARLAAGVAHRAGWLTWQMVRQALPGGAAPTVMNNQRNDGPPDLDELWRDFNRKLSGMFAGKGGGDNNGPGGSISPDPKGTGIGVGLIIGVTALIWLGSGFFTVQEGEQAVILIEHGQVDLRRHRRPGFDKRTDPDRAVIARHERQAHGRHKTGNSPHPAAQPWT